MCCCETPNVNGQPGYRWQPNDPPGIRPVSPPGLLAGDELLYDEPGRCGGIDSHCHHYRLVKQCGHYTLIVRHGGGDERLTLSLYGAQAGILAALDSNARYWIFNAIHHAHRKGRREAREKVDATWRRAAAEKRIKTRKVKDGVKVWIEPGEGRPE